MSQVKFNRGLRSSIGTNGSDDIAFISDSGTNWNSVYLGSMLVGTSLIGLTRPEKLKYKATDSASSWSEAVMGTGTGTSNLTSVVITADMSGTSAIMTCRKLVNSTGASTSGYTAGDNELLTAKAISEMVTSASVNTWYQNAVFNVSTWSWTASEQGGQNHGNLTFTLPVTSTFTSATDNQHIPTTQAVADYFAGLTGGMRYIGSLENTTAPNGTKPGDVFIAGAAISALGAEEGDMIVVNKYYTSGNLTNANTDVFERNIDGAVTTGDTLTSGKLIVGNGTKTIKTLATTAGGLLYSSAANTVADLPIGSTGQHLVVKNNNSIGWGDYIYGTVDRYVGSDNEIGDDSFVAHTYVNGNKTDSIITIDNVATASFASEARTTASIDLHSISNNLHPILVSYDTTPSGDGSDRVGYVSNVKIDASTNTLSATEVALTQSSTTINVFDTLTWHTLSAS